MTLREITRHIPGENADERYARIGVEMNRWLENVTRPLFDDLTDIARFYETEFIPAATPAPVTKWEYDECMDITAMNFRAKDGWELHVALIAEGVPLYIMRRPVTEVPA